MWLRKCSTFVGDTSLRSVKSIVELTSRMGLHMAVVPVSLCQFWRGFVFFCFEHLDDKCRIVEESCVTQRGTCMNLSWFIIERLYVCRPTCQIMVLQISQNRSLWIRKKKSTFFSKQRESAKEKLCAIFPTRISLFKSWKVGEFLWFLASVKPWLHQPKWPHRTHGFPWDPRQPRPKRPRSRSWRCVNRENPGRRWNKCRVMRFLAHLKREWYGMIHHDGMLIRTDITKRYM